MQWFLDRPRERHLGELSAGHTRVLSIIASRVCRGLAHGPDDRDGAQAARRPYVRSQIKRRLSLSKGECRRDRHAQQELEDTYPARSCDRRGPNPDCLLEATARRDRRSTRFVLEGRNYGLSLGSQRSAQREPSPTRPPARSTRLSCTDSVFAEDIGAVIGLLQSAPQTRSD